MTSLKRTLAVAGLIGLTAVSGNAFAGSVENLERERAILLETLLTKDMNAEERQGKAAISKQRLIDLERIVLRDKSLTGRNTPAVKRAFANYDLTFMVQASIEKQRSLTDHGLEQVGLGQPSVLGAVRRRR